MVTFSTPRTNVIEIDGGFLLEMLGPTGLRYVESCWAFWLDSEILAGLVLYSGNMEPEESTEVMTVDAMDRNRITDEQL